MKYFSKADLKGGAEREQMIKDFPAKRAKALKKNAKAKALDQALERRKSGSIRHLGGKRPEHEDDYPWD